MSAIFALPSFARKGEIGDSGENASGSEDGKEIQDEGEGDLGWSCALGLEC